MLIEPPSTLWPMAAHAIKKKLPLRSLTLPFYDTIIAFMRLAFAGTRSSFKPHTKEKKEVIYEQSRICLFIQRFSEAKLQTHAPTLLYDGTSLSRVSRVKRNDGGDDPTTPFLHAASFPRVASAPISMLTSRELHEFIVPFVRILDVTQNEKVPFRGEVLLERPYAPLAQSEYRQQRHHPHTSAFAP